MPMCIYINARAPHGKVSLRRAQLRFRLASTVYNGLGRQRVETNWDHICHLSLPHIGVNVFCTPLQLAIHSESHGSGDTIAEEPSASMHI